MAKNKLSTDGIAALTSRTASAEISLQRALLQARKEARHVREASGGLAQAEIFGKQDQQEIGQVLRAGLEVALPHLDLLLLVGGAVGQEVVLVHQGLLVRLPLPLCAGRHLVVLHDTALCLLEPCHHPVCLLQLQEEGLQGLVFILIECLLKRMVWVDLIFESEGPLAVF